MSGNKTESPEVTMMLVEAAVLEFKDALDGIERSVKAARSTADRVERLMNILQETDDIGPNPIDPVTDGFIPVTQEQWEFWTNLRRPDGWHDERLKQTEIHKRLLDLVSDCDTREAKIKKYQEYANAELSQREDIGGSAPMDFKHAEYRLENFLIIPRTLRCPFSQSYPGPCPYARRGQAEKTRKTQPEAD